MKKTTQLNVPDVEALEKELHRERYKHSYRRTLKSTIFALITAAAAAVLVATLWLPVLEIYGSSMEPTLQGGEIVLADGYTVVRCNEDGTANDAGEWYKVVKP